MKTFKELLIELSACKDAIIWASNKTIEEVVKECHRGDWFLWLGRKINLPLKEITLAKARCAKTVIHLMKDERSIKAVEVAERFGLGLATREELDAAASYASAAAYASAAYAASAAAAAAAAAAYAAYYAAYTTAYAADSAAAYIAYAKKENQKQTADICKEILGELIINKVNELLNQTK